MGAATVLSQYNEITESNYPPGRVLDGNLKWDPMRDLGSSAI